MALSSTLQPARSDAGDWPEAPAPGDAGLIARSQAGDVEAFNLLVERYQQRVYGLCCHMLGDADAADAAQDVFLSAFRGIRHYQGGAFIGWLLRIAKHRCCDQLRARKRRTLISLDAHVTGATTPLQIQDPGEAPDDRLLRAELADQLQRRLQDLPPDQRLVVVLRDIEGYSYEEIGVATGWPIGTVKSRLSRARARLRVVLRGEHMRDRSVSPGDATNGSGDVDLGHLIG